MLLCEKTKLAHFNGSCFNTCQTCSLLGAFSYMYIKKLTNFSTIFITQVSSGFLFHYQQDRGNDSLYFCMRRIRVWLVLIRITFSLRGPERDNKIKRQDSHANILTSPSEARQDSDFIVLVILLDEILL